MSVFYKSLSRDKHIRFNQFKRKWKRGKKCANCGERKKSSEMTVDHIIPLYEFNGSPYDTKNWQVLCLPCHREKTTRENRERLERNAKKDS